MFACSQDSTASTVRARRGGGRNYGLAKRQIVGLLITGGDAGGAYFGLPKSGVDPRRDRRSKSRDGAIVRIAATGSSDARRAPRPHPPPVDVLRPDGISTERSRRGSLQVTSDPRMPSERYCPTLSRWTRRGRPQPEASRENQNAATPSPRSRRDVIATLENCHPRITLLFFEEAEGGAAAWQRR